MPENQDQPTSASSSLPKKSRPSFLFSILWGVILFVLLAILAEAAFHNPTLSRHFPLRSVGDYHAQFEIKWFKLEDYVRQNGGVDVIILGNSMVNTGIEPAVLAKEYQSLTGKSLRIFNFGVEGLTIAPISDLASLLAERYHPGTILLFTEMRDYVAANGVSVENQFLDNPWMREQMGNPSLEGSLIDRSLLLQHLLPLRNWSRSDFMDSFFMNLRRVSDTSADGYEADRNTGKNIDQPPDPNNPKEKENFDLFANFSMDPGRVQDLRNVLALQKQGIQVVISEIPVYPTYYAYFGDETVHQGYETEIAQLLAENGSQFLPAIPYRLIPLEDRVDNHHLNYKGAPLYSKLLAQSLADLCNNDSICLQPAGGSQP